MDSISENVVAMIAVVVGILIIGTALIPIVQHASGSETTEVETGLNNDLGNATYAVKANETITYHLGPEGLTVNGKSITVSADEGGSIIGEHTLADVTSVWFKIYSSSPAVKLSSGTVTVTYNGITATGINQADGTDFDAEITSSGIRITGSAAYFAFTDPQNVTGYLSSPAKIGDGQSLKFYDFGSSEEVTITTDTASVNGLTLTHNADGTLTAAWDEESGEMEGPLGWIQTVTTSGSSQYAALYGVIPIMCILAMAYVLIRRF